MARKSDSKVAPRNGSVLVTGIVARISGCAKQKELSLGDQEAHGIQVNEEYYLGETEYRVIATKGKGERIDRPELVRIEEMLRTRELDLLIMEDIGRLVRGPAAHRLCGIAVDHGTRVLSPNDFIDTAEDSWEEDVMDACKEHMRHNAHTSRRLKQKLMNRFEKFGAATALPIFGYIKPPEAKTLDDWRKDDQYTELIVEGAARLMSKPNGAAVADYFNGENVPVGPYARNSRWDGTMILRFYRNPILKGMPGRGFKRTVKHHETGRRHSVKNPKGPTYRECPHLVHLVPEVFDALNVALDEKNAKFSRKLENGLDPRYNVPRKRTRALGQHARCWYCGRHYVWGANGITDSLMCSGAREWKCWNSIGFKGPLAASRVADAITARLLCVDGFDTQFRDLLQLASEGGNGGLEARRAKLRRDKELLRQKQHNVGNAIAAIGLNPILREKMSQLDDEEKLLRCEQHSIDSACQRRLDIPASPEDLRSLLLEEFGRLAMDSLEYGELIQQLVPEFYVYLVRLCDGGHLMPRAKVRLNLLGSFRDTEFVPGLRELLAEELTLDLFDPPERESIREDVVRLTRAGYDQRMITRLIPGKTPTQTAVWRALELSRLMEAQSMSTPYVLIDAPPPDYTKLRRHKNRRYQFETLPGYERPVL